MLPSSSSTGEQVGRPFPFFLLQDNGWNAWCILLPRPLLPLCGVPPRGSKDLDSIPSQHEYLCTRVSSPASTSAVSAASAAASSFPSRGDVCRCHLQQKLPETSAQASGVTQKKVSAEQRWWLVKTKWELSPFHSVQLAVFSLSLSLSLRAPPLICGAWLKKAKSCLPFFPHFFLPPSLSLSAAHPPGDIGRKGGRERGGRIGWKERRQGPRKENRQL